MTVKTHFTDDDFTTILAQYNLGQFVHAEAIAQGTVQTNFFLDTDQGRIVFRYYENRPTKSVLFERDLLVFLTEYDFPSPAPFKNKAGNYVGQIEQKPYMLFEFMAGQQVDPLEAKHQTQLIQKAAELQRLTTNFKSPYTAHRWNYGPDLCLKLAQVEADKIGTKDAHEKLAWLANQLAQLQLPPHLPQGICHADFDSSNILFQDDQFAALLDFDDANYTYLTFDLVGMVDGWAWPWQTEILNLAQAHQIVQMYMQHRPLSTIEQTHLFDVHKLSILFDCIWFFGRGSSDNFFEKRKISFLDNVGRQQFADALFSP